MSVNVNFEKMTQKNSRTGWEKRLRCAVKDTTDTYGLLQQDSRRFWVMIMTGEWGGGDQYAMTSIHQFSHC